MPTAPFAGSIPLPDADSVSFPVVHNYVDGTTIRWDQPVLPNGDAPEHPAPVLDLAGKARGAADHHAGPTATPAAAPPVAGAALLVAAIGAGVAIARRRA